MTSVSDLETQLLKSCFAGYCEAIRIHMTQKTAIKLSNDFYRKLLYAAAYASENKIISLLLDFGLDVNEIDCFWQNTLHYAAYSPQQTLSTVELLAKRGAEIHRCNKQWQIPLFIALAHSNPQICRFFVENMKEMNGKDKNGCTAIHYAVQSGSLEKVNIVLSRMSKIAQPDLLGRSALHYAVLQKSIPVISAIVDFDGSLVNLCDKAGNNPLHYACSRGSTDVVTLLLERGAQMDKQNKTGNTPLHVACMNNQNACVMVMLSWKCNLNVLNAEKYSPLHYAMGMDVEVFSKLVSCGAKIEDTDSDSSLLHLAVYHDNVSVVRLLVSFGFPLNLQNELGDTSLHVAVLRHNFIIAKILVSAGCDVTIKGKDAMLPFHIACCNGEVELAHILAEAMGYSNQEDIFGRSCCALSLLIGCDLFELFPCRKEASDMIDGQLRTLLHYAAINPTWTCPNTVLSSVDVNSFDRTGRTALHYAALTGGNNSKLLSCLMANGGDLSLRDKSIGYTCFHYSAFTNNPHIYNMVENKAKCEIVLRDGPCTPLHIAAYFGNNTTVQYILEQFPSLLDCVDEFGYTALEYAVFGRKMNTARILLENGATPCSRKYRSVLHLCCMMDSSRLDELASKMCEYYNVLDKQERNVLLVAYEYGNMNFVDMGSCNIHTTDRNLTNILHRTACLGLEEVCKIFMNFGVRWTVGDVRGKLCTHYAVIANKISTLVIDPYLYEIFRSYTVEDSFGFTPIHWAVYYGHVLMVEHMFCYVSSEELVRCSEVPGTAKVTPLHCAVINDDLKTAKMILEHADKYYFKLVGKTDMLNRNVMHYCGHYDAIDCYELFSSLNMSLNTLDSRGHTPLAVAVMNGSVNVLEFMLKTANLDSDYLDLDKRTYLHMACMSPKIECSYLVFNKLKDAFPIDQTDVFGRSAIFYAAKNGYGDYVNKLIQLGANVDIVDVDGLTPFVFAVGDIASSLVGLVQKMTNDQEEEDDDSSYD